MIAIEDLVVRRRGHCICRCPKLEVASGSRLAILGPNGAGKTTLLRVLAGLSDHDSGHCAIAAPPDRRVYVHQHPYFFRGSLEDNVMYGLRARGLTRDTARDKARKALAEMGLSEAGARDPERLSGGERRKAALARVLVLEPALLLLDEPLAELDEQGTEQVRAALARASAATIVIATPQELPAGLVDSVFRLEAAR